MGGSDVRRGLTKHRWCFTTHRSSVFRVFLAHSSAALLVLHECTSQPHSTATLHNANMPCKIGMWHCIMNCITRCAVLPVHFAPPTSRCRVFECVHCQLRFCKSKSPDRNYVRLRAMRILILDHVALFRVPCQLQSKPAVCLIAVCFSDTLLIVIWVGRRPRRKDHIEDQNPPDSGPRSYCNCSGPPPTPIQIGTVPQ
jgi:hypothetical protein